MVIDLFQGGTIPDHLLTAEFFGDLARCVRPEGTIVMNAVVDRYNDHAHRRLLATVGEAFSHVRDFLPPIQEEATTRNRNGYVAESNALVPANPKVRMNYVPTFMIEGVALALG